MSSQIENDTNFRARRLYVDGKYLVGGQSFGEVLATTDKLIAKARSEKSGKK